MTRVPISMDVQKGGRCTRLPGAPDYSHRISAGRGPIIAALPILGTGCTAEPPAETCASCQSDFAALIDQRVDEFTMSCGACGRLVQVRSGMELERHCQAKGAGRRINEGPWILFWKNGGKAFATVYRDGRANGPFRQRYRNGKLWVEGTQSNGSPVGLYKEWYRNGQPREVGRFDERGKRPGTWQYWTRSGKPTATEPWL